MQAYFGVITIVLFVVLVLIRTRTLKDQGIEAMDFGKKDKKDFFILPFVLFYFYIIIANAFDLPTIKGQVLFESKVLSWIGVAGCFIAILFFLWALISFKKSFRVGLVANKEQGLITTGAFKVSRNPIYVAFSIMLIGQFLIFPSWLLFIFLVIAFLRFHKQVLKEEKFLAEQYGDEFISYCNRVGRYL